MVLARDAHDFSTPAADDAPDVGTYTQPRRLMSPLRVENNRLNDGSAKHHDRVSKLVADLATSHVLAMAERTQAMAASS